MKRTWSGRITFGNRRGLEILRYTQEDLDRGLNALDMFIPEDQERIQGNIIRILKGEVLPDIEYTARRKDGRTFPVIINATPIIRGGRAAGIRGIIVDISDIKRTETALRESGSLYRALFEGTGTAMAIIEEDTTISLVNSEFENFTGLTQAGSRRPQKLARVHAARSSCLGSWSIMTSGGSTLDAAPRRYELQLRDREDRLRDIYLTVAMIPGTTQECLFDAGHHRAKAGRRKASGNPSGGLPTLSISFLTRCLSSTGTGRSLPGTTPSR